MALLNHACNVVSILNTSWYSTWDILITGCFTVLFSYSGVELLSDLLILSPPPDRSTSLLPQNALVGYNYEAALCFKFRGNSCNSFRLFYRFILAFLKNRHPLGSLTAYSLLERGRMFCLEMAADKNILHNNYSMEHISKAMESWAY